MSKQFAKLKVYELGGGVAFQTETGTVPFLVLPKGEATIKPWGASGFVFEKVVTGDVIAFVDTFDDLLDSAGVAWGASQSAVFTAVGAFFFELGGGAAASWKYPAETWQTFLDNETDINTFVLHNAGRYFGAVCLVEEEVEIDRVSMRIDIADPGNMIIGIYKIAADGSEWELVEQVAGTMNTNVTGVQTLVFAAPLTLQPDVYCFVSHSSGNHYVTVANTRKAFKGIMGFVQSTFVTNSVVFYITPYTGTLLATFPLSLTDVANTPLKLFKVSA